MGRGRRDKVNLTEEQRENLEQISRNGYAAAKKILHARILLMCDEGEQAKSNGVAYSKKNQLRPWKTQRYCIPEQDLARFVAQMEVVLDLYGTQPSEEEPLIAMDEASKQLLGEVYPPIPMQPGQDKKEDYHYSREGVQALFMFFDPHRGWRRVSNRDSRTRIDWAEEIRQLLDVDYPKARKVKLVCDNLNTHNIASLYEAFPAPVAHRLARRLEIYYTPRNGSWLNVAETELSVLSRQCLDRRISSKEELKREIETWQKERNQTASTVIWTFTTSDARVKLKHLYPVFEEEESGESIAPN